MATSNEDGNDCGAADSTSGGSPPRTRLFVPPPDHPWTGAKLACTLSIDALHGRGRPPTSTKAAAATTAATLSLPFTPSGGGTGQAKLPSLSSLFSRPVGERSSAESSPPHQRQRQGENGHVNSTVRVREEKEMSHSSPNAPNATTENEAAGPSATFPLGLMSKKSFHTISVPDATQAGVPTFDVPADVDAQGHSYSVSSDTTVASDTQQTESLHDAALGDSVESGTVRLPAGWNLNSNNSSSVGSGAPRNLPQAATPPALSCADLFVGLERPRLHHLARLDADTLISRHLAGLGTGANTNNTSFPPFGFRSMSPRPFSIEPDRTSSEASMFEDLADNAGAHALTAYRSSQLPHWWHSIVTPSVGTRVCLHSNTPRLEFWWIDRLGSEAYELLQVILKHSLEGVVTRECGETAVVVEFRIPAVHLSRTSFAVWHLEEPSAAGPSARNTAATTELWSMANESKAQKAYDDDMETLDGTVNTNVPSLLAANNNITITPIHSLLATPVTRDVALLLPDHSTATGTSPTFTVGHQTECTEMQRILKSEMPSREALLGLPELVLADTSHHAGTAEKENENNNNLTIATITTTTSNVLSNAAADGLPEGPIVLPLSCTPPPPHHAAIPVLPTSALSGDGAPHSEETSVPSIQLGHRDRTGHSSSSSGDGHVSLSPVNRSNSVVTAGGDHSDPFVVERRFHKEPSLTRILTTSPVHKGPSPQKPKTSVIIPSGEPLVATATVEDDDPSSLPSLPAKHKQCMAKELTQVAPGRFPTSTPPKTNLAIKSSANRLLWTPVTPGEKGYSPDPSDDDLNDPSGTDSHVSGTGEDTERRIALPLTGPTLAIKSQQKLDHGQASSTDRAASANKNESQRKQNRSDVPPHPGSTHDEDTSLLQLGPLLKSENTSTCQDDTHEVANFLGEPTSVSEMSRDGAHHHDNDDSVLVRLSLPSSVCIPIVAVRLHAMKLLQPLLHALTIPHNLPLFSPDSADDEDGMDSALRTATHVSPLASELVSHTATSAYRKAVQLVSDAISREEEDKLATAVPSAELSAADLTEKPPHSPIAAVPRRMQPRDLSILYTIRSHLYFHMSPDHLYDSLKDAERALSCCPSREHVCSTYEILTACLISFGHTAQVERVSARLQHRFRSPTPLLTRLGRVTQVMVAYGTLFLRQQLSPSLLQGSGGGGGGTPDYTRSPCAFLHHDSAPQSEAHAHPSRGRAPSSSTATPAVVAVPNNLSSTSRLQGGRGGRRGGTSTASNPYPPLFSPTSMPLVVVGGGIVDPPMDWGQSSSSSHHVGGGGDAARDASRTLPYEVCPLLLSHYGKSLHQSNEIHSLPYPPPLSPRTSDRSLSPGSNGLVTVVPAKGVEGSTSSATAHRQHHNSPQLSACPSNDVCHRRLFLLETLFPSVLPRVAVSRLDQETPIPRSRVNRGSPTTRGFNSTRHPLSSEDPDTDSEHNRHNPINIAVAAAKSGKKIKPEDFMYDRDSVFALLARTTETAIPYGTISMRYFGRHIRLSATRRIQKGDTVLLEKPTLMLPLWPLPHRHTARATTVEPPTSPSSQREGHVGETETATKGCCETLQRETPTYCTQCGRQRLTRVLYCPGKCGASYCSEACRREALRLYHIVECGGLADPSALAATVDTDEKGDARVRSAVAALQVIFAEWDTFLFRFASWDTPSTRSTTPVASWSPSVSTSPSPQESYIESPPQARPLPLTQHTVPQKLESHANAGCPASTAGKRNLLLIFAAAGLRAMSRLVAMMLCVVLPVESLPQLREGNEAFMKAWMEQRHAMVRAVARTLHHRGLMVSAAARYSITNAYCSGVDPHRLLLLEVMLQQLSVPFFADFTYRAPSTVWEATNEFPCAVTRKATPTSRNNGSLSSFSGAGGVGKSVDPNSDNPSQNTARSNAFTFGGRPVTSSKLTTAQREELMCTSHRMLQRLHHVIHTNLEDVFVLPLNVPAKKGDDEVMAGAPLHWTCTELLGFLSSTRVFEELLDFCLTSCAVVYPQDVEPDVAAGVSNSGSTSPTPNHCSKANMQSEMANGGDGGGEAEVSCNTDKLLSEAVAPAVPFAVISPWTCLTVDLHPILGHGGGGFIYSRFMVEHEQRRRMIAYCAAAARRRAGSGGVNLGSSGYGSGLEEESFLSIHSIASASAAAVLSASALSPVAEDLGRSGPRRDDWNIQMLEDAASRSCANLRLSLVHSISSGDATRSPTVAVVMTAKKNIHPGDVLCWESLHFGEYLYPVFDSQ